MKRWQFFSWLRNKAGWTERNIRHSPMSQCLNCSEALEVDDHYCRKCGQKIHESKLTFWSLVSEFFAGIFNLENGFYRSMSRILFPSYLSREFIQGRRKRYLNPIRFFVVTLLIHLAVINFLLDTEEIERFNRDKIEELGQSKLYDEFLIEKDSLELLGVSTSHFDKIESILFDKIKPSDQDTFINFSTNLDESRTYYFIKKDLFEMPISDFIEKYEVSTFQDRILVTQFARSMRDLSGALRFVIGNAVWGVIVSILILALLMKVLYIRRKSFYVEHIIVLSHIHAFAFLLTSIAFLFSGLQFNNGEESTGVGYTFTGTGEIGGAYFFVALYFFLTIKKYYKQGWIKSFLKFLVIGFNYLIILTFVICSTLFLSLAFFK